MDFAALPAQQVQPVGGADPDPGQAVLCDIRNPVAAQAVGVGGIVFKYGKSVAALALKIQAVVGADPDIVSFRQDRVDTVMAEAFLIAAVMPEAAQLIGFSVDEQQALIGAEPIASVPIAMVGKYQKLRFIDFVRAEAIQMPHAAVGRATRQALRSC